MGHEQPVYYDYWDPEQEERKANTIDTKPENDTNKKANTHCKRNCTSANMDTQVQLPLSANSYTDSETGLAPPPGDSVSASYLRSC